MLCVNLCPYLYLRGKAMDIGLARKGGSHPGGGQTLITHLTDDPREL